MADALPVLLLAVLLVIAVRCLAAGLHTGRRSKDPAVEPYRDPRHLMACHRPACGHMSYPHYETDEGLRCSHCGQLNPNALRGLPEPPPGPGWPPGSYLNHRTDDEGEEPPS